MTSTLPPVKGAVTYVEVDGKGPNSAQLIFTVTDNQKTVHAFVVLAYPATEPQIFVAMSNLVATAMASKMEVIVGYDRLTGQTDRATSIQLVP